MASRNRISRNLNNQRSSQLSNKLSNHHQRDPRRKFITVPEMSLEARRATLLAREDTQGHNINSSRNGKALNSTLSADSNYISSIDTNNNAPSQKLENAELPEKDRHIQTSHSSRSPLTSLNQKSGSSLRPPRLPNTGTSRSRSSISQNEPPFSMSDNEMSSHFSTNTTSNASVYTSNLSSGNNHNSSGTNHANSGINLHGHSQEDDPDDDNDSALPNEDSFEDEEESSFQRNSFVLALNKALEKHDISRLKGDITDAAQVSKPGTVRALNGGRLNNAQEVVVNVCHDDDKELVFHDDDDESIETFKAISQIRVNIWMEYNSRFPPDNDLNEFDPISFEDESPKDMESAKQRQTSAAPARSRQKTFVANQRSHHAAAVKDTPAPRNTASSDARTLRNNIKPPTSSAQSKRTTSNQRLRNVTPSPTPSRHSSGTSSRGKVNSAHSSSTKPANLLGARR